MKTEKAAQQPGVSTVRSGSLVAKIRVEASNMLIAYKNSVTSADGWCGGDGDTMLEYQRKQR